MMERFDILSWKPIPTDSLKAASEKTRRTIDPSAFVCDMGQNLAGFPSITVSGKRGQKITLIVSERLTPQGACDQSQTGRQHYYEYTLKGKDSKDLKDSKDSKDLKDLKDSTNSKNNQIFSRALTSAGLSAHSYV